MNIKKLKKHIETRIKDLEAERQTYVEKYEYWCKYHDISNVDKYYRWFTQSSSQIDELKDLLRYIERG